MSGFQSQWGVSQQWGSRNTDGFLLVSLQIPSKAGPGMKLPVECCELRYYIYATIGAPGQATASLGRSSSIIVPFLWPHLRLTRAQHDAGSVLRDSSYQASQEMSCFARGQRCATCRSDPTDNSIRCVIPFHVGASSSGLGNA